MLGLFMSAAPPAIDDEVAGHAIQIASEMFFAIYGHVAAQHAQKRFLDNVVGVGSVANDAVDICAQRAGGTCVQCRKRRLIETAHA